MQLILSNKITYNHEKKKSEEYFEGLTNVFNSSTKIPMTEHVTKDLLLAALW